MSFWYLVGFVAVWWCIGMVAAFVAWPAADRPGVPAEQAIEPEATKGRLAA